jgi:hypothetical protein
MPTTVDEILAEAGSVLSARYQSAQDGDQRVELRSVREIRESIALCAEVETRASGASPDRVVFLPAPVTL